MLPMQGAWVRSLVRELDPACMQQLSSLPAATKTWHNQINKIFLKKEKKEMGFRPAHPLRKVLPAFVTFMASREKQRSGIRETVPNPVSLFPSLWLHSSDSASLGLGFLF